MCIINKIIIKENKSNIFTRSFLDDNSKFNIFDCIQSIFESLFLKEEPEEEEDKTTTICIYNLANEQIQFNHYNCGIQPRINISQYLERFQEAYGFPEETYVYAVMCIDRLIQNTEIKLTRLNIHKLLLVSLHIAQKFLYDITICNYRLAIIGGVSNFELNNLEKQFLEDIDFGVFFDEMLVQFYYKHFKHFMSICRA